MKRKLSTKAILIMAILGVLLIIMLYPQGWTRSENAHVITFTNSKQLFVCIDVYHYGISGGILSFLLKTRDLIREDRIIWVYDNSGLRRYEVKDFPSNGGLIFFEDNIFYAIGGQRLPLPIWRWSGSTFTRLSDQEAGDTRARMDRKFRYRSDLNKSEGWEEYAYAASFQELEKNYEFEISGKHLRLLVRKVRDGWTQSNNVFLFGDTLHSEGENLSSLDLKWKRVSQSEYASMLGKITPRNSKNPDF